MPEHDPMAEILGDYRAFFSRQRDRLAERGIVIDGYAISHLAFRTLTYPEYLEARAALERHATANLENVWNGRPISKILLREPLALGGGFTTSMIELIPPQHQCLYRMGLEHVAVVIGEKVDDFALRHRAVLTGQQYQTADFRPYFVRFHDYTNVKFYPCSLKDACIAEGLGFDGFRHVAHWQG